MKKMLIGICVGAAAVVGALVYSRYRLRQKVETRPFCGWIESIKIVPPHYTDSTRTGARIDFVLRLWGTGEVRTKVKSVTAIIPIKSMDFHVVNRPVLRQNPVNYNYNFHKGVDVPFDVCAYVDDIKPPDIDGETLMVEVIDANDKVHLFERKPGERPVYPKEGA